MRLCSALVHGLGRDKWCEWGMARMEWLAFDVVLYLSHILRGGGFEIWTSLADLLERPRKDIVLDIAWIPHNLSFDVFHLHSSKAGANDRADFFLVASVPGMSTIQAGGTPLARATTSPSADSTQKDQPLRPNVPSPFQTAMREPSE